MGRIQNIQNALISINETVFQDLCDELISLENNNFHSFTRNGSQIGKQKTTKGTPDSSCIDENGKFVFIEYSTNTSQGVSKLEDDIKKCIDESKTSIPIENISKIILCFNFNLKLHEIKKIKSNIPENIELVLYSLDDLTLKLDGKYPNIVFEYLKLPFDTGQVVSIDRFIEEYSKVSQGIATPLNNCFLYREKELKEITSLISNKDIIVLKGVAGVGKTRLALESIKNFIKENTTYKAYCISYKSADLLSDLQQYFSTEKDYILLVDDANRIDHFSQIMGFYNIPRSGKLKIIVTIRDYASDFIESVQVNYDKCTKYTIKQFTDEQIVDIIKANPFNILNQSYHKEIKRIAGGNPRLAIMAALIAKEKKTLEALYDVSDLFEKYFSTFVTDNDELKKKINIKILGLTAFFYTLPYRNKEEIISILNNFEIDYKTFIEHVEILERLELLEIQYDYIKISEQNLSTFFFYKAFIKDDILSFEILLNRYFQNNQQRFKDCIISANNSFGYANVANKITPTLKKYWKSTICKSENSQVFISIFWPYLRDEIFCYIYNIINNLEKKENVQYVIDSDIPEYSFGEDKVLETLKHFFICHDEYLKNALELSFEYIRKRPEKLSILNKKIITILAFNLEDKRRGFERQKKLYEILIKGVGEKDELCTKLFYEVSRSFLSFRIDCSEVNRNGSFVFYHDILPMNTYTEELRKNIWECINDNYLQEAFSLLEYYIGKIFHEYKNIIEYDLSFICLIIEKHFSTNSFIHCKFVHDLIRACKRNNLDISFLESLSNKYSNPAYEIYTKIYWNRIGEKEIHHYADSDEYIKEKETEIKEYFVFNNRDDIESFYSNLCIIAMEKTINSLDYMRTLDIIIDETFNSNLDLGFYLLELLIKENKVDYNPVKKIEKHLNSEECVNRLWEIIQDSSNYESKEYLEIFFYYCISKSFVCDKYIQNIKNTITNIKTICHLDFTKLKNFIDFSPELLRELIKIITDDNKQIYIVNDSFKYVCDILLETDIKLLKKLYFHQMKLKNGYFDYKNESLFNILAKDHNFFVECVEFSYRNNDIDNYFEDMMNLKIIWQIDDIKNVLANVFDLVCEKDNYWGITEHFCNAFFKDLSEDTKENAKEFLLDYLKRNYADESKVNLVVDIVKNSMKELYEEVLLLFVSLTQDKELFSKVYWRTTNGVYKGGVVVGDIEAAEWNNILSIITKSKIGIKLIPIKTYIKEKIDNCKRYSEIERQRRYMEDNWI